LKIKAKALRRVNVHFNREFTCSRWQSACTYDFDLETADKKLRVPLFWNSQTGNLCSPENFDFAGIYAEERTNSRDSNAKQMRDSTIDQNSGVPSHASICRSTSEIFPILIDSEPAAVCCCFSERDGLS
jgi:hypothetical protein